MRDTYHSLIYKTIRSVNETLSALWANLTPRYSQSVPTIATRYESDQDRFVLLLNERFWLSINHADRCFVACSEMLKILLEHNRRTLYLYDKQCAGRASAIIANEHVIGHVPLHYPAMSIMDRVSRIENSIPESYRALVYANKSLELIYAILLKVQKDQITLSPSTARHDHAGGGGQGASNPSQGDANDDNSEMDGLTIGEMQSDTGGSPSSSIDEQNSPCLTKDSQNAAALSSDGKMGRDAGSEVGDAEGDNQLCGHQGAMPPNSLSGSSEREGEVEDGLTPLDPQSTDHLLQQLSKSLTDNALHGDFGERVKKEEDYLIMVDMEIQEITKALELKDEEKGSNLYAISGLGAGVAADYWMRIEKTKRARLKKIVQHHMKYSDEPEEEEQFFYRDEIFALMEENIKLPSLKELGGNKQSKRHIVLYLDCSGSCYNYAADFLKRLMSVKQADIQLDAFMFDTAVKPISIDTRHRHEFKLSRGGGTAFSCIVKHSNELLNNGDIDKRSLFIVLTDGIDNRFTHSEKSLIKNKKNWYWFLTSTRRKHHITDCGKVLKISDFI